MRKVLLVEPNYKNKYPPIGLMKLAMYYRSKGDDVRFFKGEMKDLVVELISEDLINHLQIIKPEILWKQYYSILSTFVKLGKYADLSNNDVFSDELVLNAIKEYRQKYKGKDYFKNPRFDKVGITTLFTFYWKKTIDTINFAKKLCKDQKDVMVGGIMSTLLPNEVYEETGIYPYVGLLDKAGVIDKGDKTIIDHLPLDYSILDEIDYIYPANNAYFAYMTRGCTNKCSFCAVPTLEPKYENYISLKKQIDYTREHFGEQKDLLLMDNNVLASPDYDKIIDEIKECGFAANAKFTTPNQYEIAIKNLRRNYNDRAYIRKIIKLYKLLVDKITCIEEKSVLYQKLEESYCLNYHTATKESILSLDDYVAPLYAKTFKVSKQKRIIDFNQGVEGKLVTEGKMNKLAETNIYPLRIAFDRWSLKQTYEKAIRLAVGSNIRNLSNYMLYNYQDKPEDLYNRMRLTVDLCEELDANIYSFPMKYHPINDPAFFMNRDYIGKHWNRKYIRAVQAVLNSTKGKIGKGKSFFEKAFGKDEKEFMKLLIMPETFIIYRFFFEYIGETSKWENDLYSLSDSDRDEALAIIYEADFNDITSKTDNELVLNVLQYYTNFRKDIITSGTELYKLKQAYDQLTK